MESKKKVSRVRSKSPKRKDDAWMRLLLEDFIVQKLGSRYRDIADWGWWRYPAYQFMKQHFPTECSSREWNFYGLVYYFLERAWANPGDSGPSFQAQCLLNEFCTSSGLTDGQTLLNRLREIYLRMPEDSRPRDFAWTRGWSRILRHMNQRIPFVDFHGKGRVDVRYECLFRQPDEYNEYSSPFALFETAEDILKDTADLMHKDNGQIPTGRNAASKVAIMNDVILWNLPLLLKHNFRFPALDDESIVQDLALEIELHQRKDFTVTTHIAQQLTLNPVQE